MLRRVMRMVMIMMNKMMIVTFRTMVKIKMIVAIMMVRRMMLRITY